MRRRRARLDYIPAGGFLPPAPDAASCAPGFPPGSPEAVAAYARIMRQFSFDQTKRKSNGKRPASRRRV
jgi:hypothetical protein